MNWIYTIKMQLLRTHMKSSLKSVEKKSNFLLLEKLMQAQDTGLYFYTAGTQSLKCGFFPTKNSTISTVRHSIFALLRNDHYLQFVSNGFDVLHLHFETALFPVSWGQCAYTSLVSNSIILTWCA